MTLKGFIKKTVTLIVLAGIAGLIYLGLRGGEEEVVYVTELVKTGGLEQIVEVNGTVESNSIIDLRFQKSGKVTALPYDVGDNVKSGDMLGELDTDLLSAEANILAASVNIARSNLNAELAGPKQAEIGVSEVQIQEAEVNLENAQTQLQDTIDLNAELLKTAELEVENAKYDLADAQEALDNIREGTEDIQSRTEIDLSNVYMGSDIAVLNSISEIRNTVLTADSILGVDNTRINDSFEQLFENPYVSIRPVLAKYDLLKEAVDLLANNFDGVRTSWTTDEADMLLSMSDDTLLAANELMDDIYAMIEDAEAANIGDVDANELNPLKLDVVAQIDALSIEISAIEQFIRDIEQAKLDIPSTEISSRTEIDQAEALVTDAENRLKLAEANLEEVKLKNQVAENADLMQVNLQEVRVARALADHNNLLAGPRDADVASLNARIGQEQARYQKALREIEDTKIFSPVNGVVTELNVDVGENVSSADEVVRVITPDLQIRANITETDIANVSVGDPVRLTLDAFPIATSFTGVVDSIDPAETVIQGVVYFQTIIKFDSFYPIIKSGMTANLDINTAGRDQALVVPPQAVNFVDDESYVFVLENGEKVERKIEIGLDTDDGIEVLSGLEEGEEVILYEE